MGGGVEGEVRSCVRCVEGVVAREMGFFTDSTRMEEIGGGNLVKAVCKRIISSINCIVLPGKVEFVWHIATSSRLVVPVLLRGSVIVRVSTRRGLNNNTRLREVKLVWTSVMRSSFVGPILLSGGSIRIASLKLGSGIEVVLGIGAQLKVLIVARYCPDTFAACPAFVDPA
jgi:hypothetical protein